MKEISLVTLSKALSIRTKRLETKAHKLALQIQTKHSLPYLSAAESVILLNSYVQSKKVAAGTRDRAMMALRVIENNESLLPSTPMVPALKRGKAKGTAGQRNLTTTKKTGKWPSFCTQFTKHLLDCISGLSLPILKRLVHFIQTKYFKFVALFVAILVQMHHSAIWFQRTKPDGEAGGLSAYGYAFMVDLFILVITMEGRITIARTFAWLTFISNLLYFQFWVGFDFSVEAVTKAISAVLISAIIAYVIYAYTELFVHAQQNRPAS